jgi:glycine/D-amino acid oxidase-like deaminating enzyme
MDVLICGGGVIGASTAYFLNCRGIRAIVIERCGLACAASGKSGGFLARDWCDGSPLAPLARRSFVLHGELAQALAGDLGWGYRRLDTYGGFAGFGRRGGACALEWLSDAVTVTEALGSPDTTAQVHPVRFNAAMMRAALTRGAKLRLGRVTGVMQRNGRATGVEVEGTASPATPWSLGWGRGPLRPARGCRCRRYSG